MPRIRKSALSGSRRPAQLTASPIPPPNDGTSGELGFIQPRSSFSYQLPQLPQDVKSLFVWFTSNKHPLCLMYKYGQHTASLLWHDGQARWGPRKLSISKEREGAEIGQRMRVPSDNRLASCPSQARSLLLLLQRKLVPSIHMRVENHGDLAGHRDLGALHAAPLGGDYSSFQTGAPQTWVTTLGPKGLSRGCRVFCSRST